MYYIAMLYESSVRTKMISIVYCIVNNIQLYIDNLIRKNIQKHMYIYLLVL